jgi:hexosaminidase
LQLGVDESYSLEIPDDTEATLTATTVWGALRGLETFSQIIQYQTTNVKEAGSVLLSILHTRLTPPSFPPFSSSCRYYMPWTPISIKDEPRYPWRGLLVDSARHYLSVPLLEKTIDSMAAMKLNTLHWHIVDAESFPFVSSKYPGPSFLLPFSSFL